MSEIRDQVNRTLETQAPALYAALSPLGRRMFYPPDIPVQAQEARQTTYNGTIGIFTDGAGSAVPLPSMDAVLDLSEKDRNQAFLYSPVPGFDEVRDLWAEWQREGMAEAPAICRPFASVGLAHALSIIADLFGGEGRAVAIPTPYWGNYRQNFALRTGAVMRSAPAYQDRRYNPLAVEEALADLPPGEPAVAMLNFPSNPGGYSPTRDERVALRDSLIRIAEQRPLVTVHDDAYNELVYEPDVPKRSFFWDMVGAHEQLIPIKVDGATKEFSFFGGRVGFLTFGLDLAPEVEAALENKLKSISRSTLGSPVATSQVILLQALRDGRGRSEVAAVRKIADERYRAIRPALEALDSELLRLLPFNSGFFVLLELPEELGLDPHAVRRHLIEHHSTGIVSIAPRYLRLATCSVAADALPELVARVERGVRELAGK
ncbi:MAG: aminotransferase class I/II-fold pyridoxal phosphate-dependent enzyme [Acidobacteriota bacterium]